MPESESLSQSNQGPGYRKRGPLPLTGKGAGQLTSEVARVRHAFRDTYNVTPATVVPQAETPGAVMLVVRVTGELSDNGLHPAKLYLLDNMPQLNDPPDPIVWVEVTGDFNVKPMPGQTLAAGDTGVAVLVGSYGGAPVYALGGGASPGMGCTFTIRKVDCVSVTGNALTTAYWNAVAGGWRLVPPVMTGDGPAVGVIQQDDRNRYVVKLESENATWYLNPTGRCDSTGASIFRGDYLPLELQDVPGDSGSGGSGSGGSVEPCAAEVIELKLKCVPCTLACGAFGPFPAVMCVATAPTPAGPSPTFPDMACSFFYGMTFDPVTVVFGATGTWGAVGVDFPVSFEGVYFGPDFGAEGFPSHDVPVRWFGVGRLTHATGTFTYGVEIWFDSPGCAPRITYYLPTARSGGIGSGAYYLKLLAVTMPFGTPAGYNELPPIGSFPITVPAYSVLPAYLCHNSSETGPPCGYGIISPDPYVSCVNGGTFELGPATVYSGGCSDPGGSEGGSPSCCNGPGGPFEGLTTYPAAKLTIPDGPNAGEHTGVASGLSWNFSPFSFSYVGCLVDGTWHGFTGSEGVTSTAVACSPSFAVVFPGEAFGATGDVILELA